MSSAQREVARAEQAGVISSRRLGNTRLVTAADSPLTGPRPADIWYYDQMIRRLVHDYDTSFSGIG